ncbi:hypothetical protein [Clostridium sp. Marseille-P299]|nr:hypothetical protein [Clostridium sp. Marseille-P299]
MDDERIIVENELLIDYNLIDLNGKEIRIIDIWAGYKDSSIGY